MTLTSDPKRIEEAHHLLQRLEDFVVGCRNPTNTRTPEQADKMHNHRLDEIWEDVWAVIYKLNEAYDGRPLPRVANRSQK